MQFIIENKAFTYAPMFTSHDQFTVTSIPRPYQVIWDNADNPFIKIQQILEQNKNNLLVIDEKVYQNYATKIAWPREKIFLIAATEDNKSLTGATRLIDFLQTNEITKGEQLIVVGGGITQDLAGFVAAMYKRGIPWYLFPTTLLSMCDSCIGGKTGINYHNAKNQLALFSAPTQVIINPEFLTTLGAQEIKSGLGEILKLAITAGEPLIALFSKSVQQGQVVQPEYFKPLIMGALSIKKAVVEVDEFEQNYRKSLNYGHTFGHAFEILSGYKIPHGLAVVMGMLVANDLSMKAQLLDKNENRRLKNLCLSLLSAEVVATARSLDVQALLPLLKKDKKTLNARVNLVLLKKPGELVFKMMDLNAEFLEVIQDSYQNIFRELLSIH